MQKGSSRRAGASGMRIPEHRPLPIAKLTLTTARRSTHAFRVTSLKLAPVRLNRGYTLAGFPPIQLQNRMRKSNGACMRGRLELERRSPAWVGGTKHLFRLKFGPETDRWILRLRQERTSAE
jgi:hypothetical protein